MNRKPAFVCVHGAWHSGATWDKLAPLLEAAGHRVFAPDLPGSGKNAKWPEALGSEPFDSTALALEPSPNAAVTQEERTEAILEVVRSAAEIGNGKVVLVGHSLGGLTVSAVVEAAPELIHSAVFLTAFMLPPGMPAIAMIQHETTAEATVLPLVVADPEQVGAIRLNPKSSDPVYLESLKNTFYGDVDDSALKHFVKTLHSDEPAGVTLAPTQTTVERFGQVPRFYLRCTLDNAIPLTGQNFMIEAVDAAMGNDTRVLDLASSHSPFLSMPEKLADLLLEIAR